MIYPTIYFNINDVDDIEIVIIDSNYPSPILSMQFDNYLEGITAYERLFKAFFKQYDEGLAQGYNKGYDNGYDDCEDDFLNA